MYDRAVDKIAGMRHSFFLSYWLGNISVTLLVYILKYIPLGIGKKAIGVTALP
jgi:hypothetical protein